MSKTVHIDEFVAGLKAFQNDYITKDRIAEYYGEREIDQDSLERYVTYRDDRYSRNLIYRDELFEVMLLGWMPGQMTPVHTHNGQLGWVRVQRGSIEIVNYRYLSCSTPENQQVSGIDCLGGGADIKLERKDERLIVEGGPVGTVDKTQTIHHMACPKDGDRTATVHIYSRPFSSCVAFDIARGECRRRELVWDTEYGDPTKSVN